MPIVQAWLAAPRSAPTGRAVAQALHQHTVQLLRKQPDLIAIALHWVDPQDWFVAGRPLAGEGLASAFVEVRVTDETNTKDEKARFIAAVHADLQRLLGPLHEESYIHVHDVRAAAYGYGGRTQEARYHRPVPA